MPSPWAAGAQARIAGTLHGQQTMNVLHFATNTAIADASPPSPLLIALVEAIVDCVLTTLLPAVTQDWTFDFCDAKFVHVAGANAGFTDPVIQTPPANSKGTLGVTSVSFAASLVNIRSGFGGRSGRGKMFLPPAGEAQITNSQIDAGTEDLIVAFLTCMAGKFLGVAPTTDWRLGVLSRKLAGPTLANFDAGFFVASQLSPSANVAVLSRRKKGHGR